MPIPRPILIDPSPHQREAITAVKKAFIKSHGSAFALEFIRLHRSAIYNASRTRVCGRSATTIDSDWVDDNVRCSGP